MTEPTSQLAADLGTLLRHARGNTSLDELAREHGLTKATLHELESGTNNPTLARIERYAAIYGITLTITRRQPTRKPASRRPQPTQETLT